VTSSGPKIQYNWIFGPEEEEEEDNTFLRNVGKYLLVDSA
jgi:hypothetical protein